MRSDLPSGTVTFLFTDVEGSTALLHELGAAEYAEALAEHRRLIREACAAQGGVEVDTQGDAFFFAFPTAPGAISAASAFTESLASGPIQVRVGLHTGTPHLGSEGYVGNDVHLGARIAASAHGGQVIVSAATAKSVDLELTHLGEHRLKDIPQAMPIFQLGDESFPPLKTISNTNLPTPASSFVGRDDELQEVLSRIEGGARLVTLTGPGGTGKTRLAIEAAAALVPEYTAGVFWVGLATLRDPALVTETIAQTLGAKDALAEHIGERELLLLLDNLEQVIDCAPELSELLTACPNVNLLVTSRELLRIQGEVEYAVPPLAQDEAVSLFCARSQLEPSEEIAELCRRLDDMPLAVELAAARASALSPEQILERLSQRLDLLKGGRDADPRQQTLRATIEWSYELLDQVEQQLFAHLSVFTGGCTLEAAEEVCDADLDTLQSLVEKSLLRFTDGRYWMLETILEYAAQRLNESGGEETFRAAHAGYVAGRSLELRRLRDTDFQRHVDELANEQVNFRAALEWMVSNGDPAALYVFSELGRLWAIRGNWREGRRWTEEVLASTQGERSVGRAAALGTAIHLAGSLGEFDDVKRYLEESLSIVRELGNAEAVAATLGDLGFLAAELNDFDEAERLLDQAAAEAEAAGATPVLATVLGNQADVALRRGDYARALELSDRCLVLCREIGRDDLVGWALSNLAHALHRLGRTREATITALEGLRVLSRVGDAQVLAWTLVLLGATLATRGESEGAATLLGAAEGIIDRADGSFTGAEAELHADTVAELRTALGEENCNALVSAGRAMSTADAVEYATSATR